MYRERGTIKWTSLMLPEHIERLKHLENIEIPLKEWTDWELEELQSLLIQQKSVVITYIHDGRIATISGVPSQTNEGLHIQHGFSKRFIPYHLIQAVDCDD